MKLQRFFKTRVRNRNFVGNAFIYSQILIENEIPFSNSSGKQNMSLRPHQNDRNACAPGNGNNAGNIVIVIFGMLRSLDGSIESIIPFKMQKSILQTSFGHLFANVESEEFH